MASFLRFRSILQNQNIINVLINSRNIYNGKHVIYPSSEWFTNYTAQSSYYQELINPMMTNEILSEEEVHGVKRMLDDQSEILRQHGKVHLLNPLVQTLDQYLFGVPDITDRKNVKRVLINLGLLAENGSLDMKYEAGSLLSKEESAYELRNCTKYVSAVVSALNGIASRAMDTIYFANLWLYLGLSSKLIDRPIVVIQSPKYHTRQIERYYGIIACMSLGVTPVQIGADSQGRSYFFEGMADVLPIKDKNDNPLLICSHSSRSHMESYGKLEYIHQHLGIQQRFPELFFIAELQEKFKQLIFHLDLAMHVDENDNLYLGENILESKDEEALLNQIGHKRVIYIPEAETKRYGLNAALYDGRFGASEKIAIIRDDCPVLRWELSKNGYKIYPRKEVFPHGGGSARCRVATLDVGEPHSLESFLDEQLYIEGRLGPSHATITSDQVGIFKDIYNSSHLQDILHSSN